MRGRWGGGEGREEGEKMREKRSGRREKNWVNIVAAFRGMHVSPAKHRYAWLPRKCDYWTDTQTDGQTDAGQSDPYVPLCFAGDTKMGGKIGKFCAPLREGTQGAGGDVRDGRGRVLTPYPPYLHPVGAATTAIHKAYIQVLYARTDTYKGSFFPSGIRM